MSFRSPTPFPAPLIAELGEDPGFNYHAHHIVPQKAGAADDLRQILAEANIDIHDPANGVFLQDTYHLQQIHGARFRDYIDAVTERLAEARLYGPGEVRKELRLIGIELKFGTFQF